MPGHGLQPLARVPAQGGVAGRAGVSGFLHAVHAARNAAAGHAPDDAEQEPNDPGCGAGL